MMDRENATLGLVTRLLESDSDQLLAELAMRAKTIEGDPSKRDMLDPPISVPETAAMGPKALRVLGERVLNRWNREAYQLVCGSGRADLKTREDLARALGVGDAATSAALTTALLAIPGLPAALAPVLAVIFVKRFLAPAMDEFCQYWSQSLPQHS
jgi:hypothetical protein